MAKRVKKEVPVPGPVTIYKVVVAPYFSYYTRSLNPILKVTFTKEEAEKYIRDYPFLWIKPFLSIETLTQQIRDTD